MSAKHNTESLKYVTQSYFILTIISRTLVTVVSEGKEHEARISSSGKREGEGEGEGEREKEMERERERVNLSYRPC